MEMTASMTELFDGLSSFPSRTQAGSGETTSPMDRFLSLLNHENALPTAFDGISKLLERLFRHEDHPVGSLKILLAFEGAGKEHHMVLSVSSEQSFVAVDAGKEVAVVDGDDVSYYENNESFREMISSALADYSMQSSKRSFVGDSESQSLVQFIDAQGSSHSIDLSVFQGLLRTQTPVRTESMKTSSSLASFDVDPVTPVLSKLNLDVEPLKSARMTVDSDISAPQKFVAESDMRLSLQSFAKTQSVQAPSSQIDFKNSAFNTVQADVVAQKNSLRAQFNSVETAQKQAIVSPDGSAINATHSIQTTAAQPVLRVAGNRSFAVAVQRPVSMVSRIAMTEKNAWSVSDMAQKSLEMSSFTASIDSIEKPVFAQTQRTVQSQPVSVRSINQSSQKTTPTQVFSDKTEQYRASFDISKAPFVVIEKASGLSVVSGQKTYSLEHSDESKAVLQSAVAAASKTVQSPLLSATQSLFVSKSGAVSVVSADSFRSLTQAIPTYQQPKITTQTHLAQPTQRTVLTVHQPVVAQTPGTITVQNGAVFQPKTEVAASSSSAIRSALSFGLPNTSASISIQKMAVSAPQSSFLAPKIYIPSVSAAWMGSSASESTVKLSSSFWVSTATPQTSIREGKTAVSAVQSASKYATASFEKSQERASGHVQNSAKKAALPAVSANRFNVLESVVALQTGADKQSPTRNTSVVPAFSRFAQAQLPATVVSALSMGFERSAAYHPAKHAFLATSADQKNSIAQLFATQESSSDVRKNAFIQRFLDPKTGAVSSHIVPSTEAATGVSLFAKSPEQSIVKPSIQGQSAHNSASALAFMDGANRFEEVSGTRFQRAVAQTLFPESGAFSPTASWTTVLANASLIAEQKTHSTSLTEQKTAHSFAVSADVGRSSSAVKLTEDALFLGYPSWSSPSFMRPSAVDTASLFQSWTDRFDEERSPMSVASTRHENGLFSAVLGAENTGRATDIGYASLSHRSPVQTIVSAPMATDMQHFGEQEGVHGYRLENSAALDVTPTLLRTAQNRDVSAFDEAPSMDVWMPRLSAAVDARRSVFETKESLFESERNDESPRKTVFDATSDVREVPTRTHHILASEESVSSLIAPSLWNIASATHMTTARGNPQNYDGSVPVDTYVMPIPMWMQMAGRGERETSVSKQTTPRGVFAPSISLDLSLDLGSEEKSESESKSGRINRNSIFYKGFSTTVVSRGESAPATDTPAMAANSNAGDPVISAPKQRIGSMRPFASPAFDSKQTVIATPSLGDSFSMQSLNADRTVERTAPTTAPQWSPEVSTTSFVTQPRSVASAVSGGGFHRFAGATVESAPSTRTTAQQTPLSFSYPSTTRWWGGSSLELTLPSMSFAQNYLAQDAAFSEDVSDRTDLFVERSIARNPSAVVVSAPSQNSTTPTRNTFSAPPKAVSVKNGVASYDSTESSNYIKTPVAEAYSMRPSQSLVRAPKDAEPMIAFGSNGDARVMTAEQASNGLFSSALNMSIVQAIAPKAPSMEAMAQMGGGRAQAFAKGKNEGSEKAESTAKQDSMALQGTIDSLAQRIYHRLKRRLQSDRERFGG